MPILLLTFTPRWLSHAIARWPNCPGSPRNYPRIIPGWSSFPQSLFPSTSFTGSVSYSASGFQRFQRPHPDLDPWRPRHPAVARVALESAPEVGGTPPSPGLSLPISARGRINWAFWRAISLRWWVSLISQRSSMRYTRCPRTVDQNARTNDCAKYRYVL